MKKFALINSSRIRNRKN